MAATDLYRFLMAGLDSPGLGGETVTPSDTQDLTNVSRGLWVGAAGDVAVILLSGSTVTLVGVTAGTLIPIRASRVLATGTTATSIVALW